MLYLHPPFSGALCPQTVLYKIVLNKTNIHHSDPF